MKHHGNSYYELYYHVTFATKRRMPVLDKTKIFLINEIARKKSEDLNFVIHILNGYKDHVHILLSVPPSLALSRVIKDIKGPTSRAIPELTWQEGYYVKSIHKEIFDSVYQYIAGQWPRHDVNNTLTEWEE